MTTAFDLIAESIRDEWVKLPCEPVEGTCAVTGRTRMLCIPIKKAISGNFVGWNELADPNSDLVGITAYQTLKFRPERSSSWVVSKEDGFRKLRRVEVRPLVLDGVDSQEWSGFVTTSYKKHGAFRSTVNNSRYGVWRFDDMRVDCSNIEKVKQWWDILNGYIHKGISRNCLERGDIDQWAVKKVGPLECYNFTKWANPRSTNPLYRFLCYLLPSQEEIKNES